MTKILPTRPMYETRSIMRYYDQQVIQDNIKWMEQTLLNEMIGFAFGQPIHYRLASSTTTMLGQYIYMSMTFEYWTDPSKYEGQG